MAVDMKDIIIYFDIKNKGDWDKVYRDIAMKKKVDLAGYLESNIVIMLYFFFSLTTTFSTSAKSTFFFIAISL